MCKFSLRLSLAVLFLSAVPIGCTESPGSTVKGSGGAGGGSKSGGSGGGSSASGGSGGTVSGGRGGTSSATGGAAGSGGSASGGASGGSGGGGTTSGTGGDASGGTSGGTGGAATGGDSGNSTGGGGGTSTGAGGTSTGGGGGTSIGDAGLDEMGGTGGGNFGEVGNDVGNDTLAPTCTDNAQNGVETDIDCGGGTCPKCGAGQNCQAGTDCKSGTCTANKCADPFAATGTVTQNGNRWKITAGTLIFEVSSDVSGMIVTLNIDGSDVLVINNGNSQGAVFWTAPQSDWNWPPPSEMDGAAYTPSSSNNVLTMTGPVGSTDNISITKRYWVNTDNLAVTIEYTIKNGGTTAITKAPWEISRVYPGGLTFFPNAEDPVVLPGTSNSFLAVPFTTGSGAAWFKYQASAFTQDIKGGADGLEGWAAHVVCGTGLEKTCTGTKGSPVLIKEWPDTTTQAPSEKEVEIYANAGHNYVEFEQQGDYQSIPAGGTLVWTVHWLVRYLPSTVAPTAGSADLVTWVRGQLL